MSEQTSVEQLAKMILRERQRDAVVPLAHAIHAQCEQEQAKQKEFNDSLAKAYQAKKEKEREQEQARRDYEEKQKAEQPQRTHDVYAAFLHQLKGEDEYGQPLD